MSNVNDVSDEELAELMAELEAQNEELMAQQKAAEPTPGDFDKILNEGMAAINAATEAVVAILSEEKEAKVEAAVAGGVEIVPDEALPDPAPASADGREASIRLPDHSIPITTERRVIQDEQGNVLQPAMNFSEKPAEPAEVSRPDGLKHYVDVTQFNKDTRVTEHTLDQCMIEQNGLRSYYGAQAAYAEAQHSRLKARFEVIEATLYDKHRKALAASGEKTTEKMVENAVKLDPRWLKAKNLVIEAETIAAINKGLVESIKDRRDMIIQLGADRRDEYKGAARILAEKNERADLTSRASAAARQAFAG